MTDTKSQTAIRPTRQEDFPEWYQQVIKAGDLAENSPVRGCMVIKPWGFAIWEKIQENLDRMIKETGHENAYFPLFIPLSFLEKEAQHVEGFAKECAVVTHHRLEEKEGKLVPAGPLEEPLIVRPTSEMIIGHSFSKWVNSYRDLPLKINQWANVVRWEMRTRIFLRTAEFLWQEGHTVHETKEEAMEETLQMLEIYRQLCEDYLALPVILGEKTEGERFPGAVNTFCIEMMMQDRKALQGGTSHFLGQNFSKSCGIQFSNRNSSLDHPYTTSWGVTTRLIGGLIMVHSDDDGLRLPPKIAPKQIVIMPVVPKAHQEEAVFAYADKLKKALEQVHFGGERLRVHVDKRDIRGGEKNWGWIKKGVPIRIEVGPKDLEKEGCVFYRRDRGPKEKDFFAFNEVCDRIHDILEDIQKQLFNQALEFQKEHMHTEITNFEELKAFFTPENQEKPEIHGGFVFGKWCNEKEAEALLEPLKVTIRCLPLKQSGTEGTCIVTGKKATMDAIFAKSY